jgi:hypothetical protein
MKRGVSVQQRIESGFNHVLSVIMTWQGLLQQMIA